MEKQKAKLNAMYYSLLHETHFTLIFFWKYTFQKSQMHVNFGITLCNFCILPKRSISYIGKGKEAFYQHLELQLGFMSFYLSLLP